MYKKILITICLFLVACSAQRLDPPEISLQNVMISDVQFLQTTLASTILIDNPSPESLNVTGAVHSLYINGKNVGRASSSDSMLIPAFGQSEQRVNFKLDNLSMYRNFTNLIQSANFTYRIDSKLYTDDSSWPIKVETERKYGF